MVITFCKNKCCPVVEVTNEGLIKLGDANGPEGVTTWTKQNLKDFVEAAKDGKFDSVVNDVKCECGEKWISECKPHNCLKD